MLSCRSDDGNVMEEGGTTGIQRETFVMVVALFLLNRPVPPRQVSAFRTFLVLLPIRFLNVAAVW